MTIKIISLLELIYQYDRRFSNILELCLDIYMRDEGLWHIDKHGLGYVIQDEIFLSNKCISYLEIMKPGITGEILANQF